MDEKQWNDCVDPRVMLEFLRGNVSDRKLRLFACACCRGIDAVLDDTDCLQAVEIGEAVADGAPQVFARGIESFNLNEPAHVGFQPSVFRYDRPSVLHRYGIVDLFGMDARIEERVEQICNREERFPIEVAVSIATRTSYPASLLRDIVGPLAFRDIHIDPTCLAWCDQTPVKLARAAYEERSLTSGELDNGRLGVLADALEESGLTNDEVLSHLRSPGPHYRGCWALDLVLGFQ